MSQNPFFFIDHLQRQHAVKNPGLTLPLRFIPKRPKINLKVSKLKNPLTRWWKFLLVAEEEKGNHHCNFSFAATLQAKGRQRRQGIIFQHCVPFRCFFGEKAMLTSHQHFIDVGLESNCLTIAFNGPKGLTPRPEMLSGQQNLI
ncbi:MAG: hypothetical protein CM15mP84_10430 [Cellvibrionales bacterium]|nr:MAG: hypothetical protein CM15mP84_10430 [Cellvibrionales bacterium]